MGIHEVTYYELVDEQARSIRTIGLCMLPQPGDEVVDVTLGLMKRYRVLHRRVHGAAYPGTSADSWPIEIVVEPVNVAS